MRVLLNDSTVFDHPSKEDATADDEHAFEKSSKPKINQNQVTVDALNRACGRIDARIANIKAMGVTYIHNKGMMVDGDKVLISSINWNENAVEKNREAAVVLHGSVIHDYYHSLFDGDWGVSH